MLRMEKKLEAWSRDWYSAPICCQCNRRATCATRVTTDRYCNRSGEVQNSNLDPPHGVWQYAARTVYGGRAQRILLIPLSSTLRLIPD